MSLLSVCNSQEIDSLRSSGEFLYGKKKMEAATCSDTKIALRQLSRRPDIQTYLLAVVALLAQYPKMTTRNLFSQTNLAPSLDAADTSM